jgi:hypothetical protein
MTTKSTTKTQLLALLVAGMVVLSTTAGLAAAATTTDLTVSITDDDDTIAPGETTTVQIAVTNVDGGVGAGELGIELSDPGVAAITDVSVLNAPGSTDNAVVGGGQSADVKYAFASGADDDGVVIVEATLQAAAEGSTTIEVVQNSQTGNLVLFDENGAGYTLDTVGSATLTVEEPPADFQVSNLQAPGSATQGDLIDVSADVQNDGGQTATKSVEFRVDVDGDGFDADDDVVLSESVELAPGESETVTFEDVDTSALSPNTYTHGVVTEDDSETAQITIESPPEAANFQVSNLQAPASATQGDLIDVSADVDNTGDQTATKSVEFRVDADGDGDIDDESAVLSQDVELAGGASTTVTFEDVDTSALPVGTLTHGVASPDDSETAQITVEEPASSPDKETTVSLQPAEQTTAVGSSATYDVVVDNAQGGVGAGEIRVSVDDPSVATITDAELSLTAGLSQELTDSYVEFDYFGADTDDTGGVVVATVTLEGASAGSTGLSIEPAAGNSEVLVFDEGGTGYDVTGTNGATLDVEAVQFSVSNLDAPERAAVGSTATVTADITNDGTAESTQPVEFRLDVDGDGTLETVATEQVTLAGGETTQVSFEVTVPEDASFGVRDHGVFTLADDATAQIEFTPPDVNGDGLLPNDLDGDGRYEDVNGDGSADVGDAQALFSARDSPAIQEYVAQYDFNDDGVVNVGDAQALFGQLSD